MKKQLIQTLLIGVLVVSLTACTSNNTDTKEAQAVKPTAVMVTDKPYSSENSQEVPSTDTQKKADTQSKNNDTPVAAVQPTSAPNQTVKSKNASSEIAKSKTSSSKTTKSKTAPSKKPSGGAKASEYLSGAPVTSIDTIQISPKHVYYKDSKLYMDAYVYNGFNHSVFNITNVGIQLSNKSGIISESKFGGLENQTIDPHSYIVWTFIFSSDAVKQQNANLDVLDTKFQCNNSY